jgi:hypothetical protein
MLSFARDTRRPPPERSAVGLPEFELPKVDVAKVVTDAAVAVGLAKRSRRWPFAVGALVVLTAAGLVAANATAIRGALGEARRWVAQRVSPMGTDDDPAAITAAEAMSTQPEAFDPVPGSTPADYPKRVGASPDAVTANGRSSVGTPR